MSAASNTHCARVTQRDDDVLPPIGVHQATGTGLADTTLALRISTTC